ncbi:unnamed protein product [Lepeophtheirus salmonis]|uniref:(salmon louse) hypothetical protein n=1 Tax=Lepeophtheirus salmonis TaxID=72036 RepID=A0A7R8H5H9_LEPSM|nr:unnamed protein product [Lepeophtheirus salmonis]CAF2876673.1 unnamed protein product [Lepeophtheirus salmonis]
MEFARCPHKKYFHSSSSSVLYFKKSTNSSSLLHANGGGGGVSSEFSVKYPPYTSSIMATSVWLCSNDKSPYKTHPSENLGRSLNSLIHHHSSHPHLLSLCNVYSDRRFRQRVRNSVFEDGTRNKTTTTFSLDMNRTSIIDVTVDDDLNIFALAMSVITGRTHVMSCSLFTEGRSRWIHRFTDNGFLPGSLTCIAAGHRLVALGCRDGKIRLYESLQQFKYDMTIGIANILPNGSLVLSKILHGHVSRIRAVDAQGNKAISGSDDRSVKLWNLSKPPGNNVGENEDDLFERPLMTMTGHSGPVTGVQLAYPWALSSSGCTVRLWNVDNGNCHRLLRHESSPVTAFTWMSTFRAVATVDGDGIFRCFNLEEESDDLVSEQEILEPSTLLPSPLKVSISKGVQR